MTSVDAVLFLLDASLNVPEKLKEEKEKELAGYMEQMQAPAILILNKVDLLDKEKLLPLIQMYADIYPFKAILPLSALHADGTDRLITEILSVLPFGPRYFPEDIPTDATERFLTSEIIREKIFLLTGQEIPYSSAVLIESFKEDPEKQMVTIHAAIVVERTSQKGIVIGKGGRTLKQIGIAARKDIEKMLEQKVLLKLWVKVKKNWPQDERFLKELGFI
jgi:GTPase